MCMHILNRSCIIKAGHNVADFKIDQHDTRFAYQFNRIGSFTRLNQHYEDLPRSRQNTYRNHCIIPCHLTFINEDFRRSSVITFVLFCLFLYIILNWFQEIRNYFSPFQFDEGCIDPEVARVEHVQAMKPRVSKLCFSLPTQLEIGTSRGQTGTLKSLRLEGLNQISTFIK